MPWGNSFKFETTVHFDSRTDWLDFCPSKMKVTVTSQCPILVQWYLRRICKGKSPCWGRESVMNQISLIRAAWREDPQCSLQFDLNTTETGLHTLTAVVIISFLPKAVTPWSLCLSCVPQNSDPLVFYWTVRVLLLSCKQFWAESCPSYDSLTH